MAGGNAFSAPYWNLAQVFAWISLRDPQRVEQFCAPEGERPSASLIAIELALDVPEESPDPAGCAQSSLIRELQAGALLASGIPAHDDVREEIPALEWLDLRLSYEPDQALAKNPQGVWEPRWIRLQFPRVEVLRLWPEARVHVSSGVPKDLDYRSLLGWMKHDVWTAAEALLLLHGKEPTLPYTEDHELTTHFLQAKVYLNRALQGGTVGHRREVDGRKQWVDTPSRWYEWAETKFPVATFVRIAFRVARFEKTPRIHFLRAKKLLADRISDLNVEEIAMWIFDDELLAWFSAEPGAERFSFGKWVPSEDLQLLSRLTDTYFSQEQIDQFDPDERWLTYPLLRARWAGLMEPDEAAALIESRHTVGELLASHPIAGLVADDGEPGLEDCLFPLSQVQGVEVDVGIAGAGDNSETFTPNPEKSTVSAEKACRERLINEMRAKSKPEKSKKEYRDQLRADIPGLAIRAFDRAWRAAIEATGKENWMRPGRKS